MRPLGLFRGSIKLVRTVLSDGRSDRTRCRCIRPFMSRDPGRARTLVRGIGILELLGLFEDTTHSRGKATQVLQGPLGPEGMGNRMGGQDHLRPEGAVRETELLLEEAAGGTSAPRLPSRREGSPLLGLLIGPAGSIRRLGRFEHDKSPRNPAAPSTPRTGDRPVRDKPMFFGYCYGKCTAQQCKYLHQKPPPGTKPITPRTTAGPVVEDEEGDTPRSPTPSPPDREARRLDSPAQGLTDF